MSQNTTKFGICYYFKLTTCFGPCSGPSSGHKGIYYIDIFYDLYCRVSSNI